MELIYKVWDKEQKKFLRIDNEEEGCAKINYNDGLYFTLNGRCEESLVKDIPYEIDAEILPSTGTKDINKKESYLGDIVKIKINKWSREKEKEKSENSFGIVKKENDSNNMYLEWNFKRKYQGGYYWETNDLPIWKIKEYEIVGNIYENIEIIKREV